MTIRMKRGGDELRRLIPDLELPSHALAARHAAIREVIRLLQTATCLRDGQHVYALRTLMAKVSDDLECQPACGEQELFPMPQRWVPDRSRSDHE